jgi:MoCo/4Fe-4S cofactor protein with predicted Tat translocation signal
MGMTRKYWKGLDELKETSEFLNSRDQEFPADVTVDEFLGDESLKETSTARRDFLKFLGFSVAAATVAACEAPVTKVIPYVNKPEDVMPGMPTWYASTYYDGVSYASILVKTREGRPIYIKGNKDYGFTQGGTNAQIIASVLGLYDSARLQSPISKGKETTWSSADDAIKAAIKSAGKVTLVSNSIISPSVGSAISELATAAGADKFEHIQYDAVSYAGMRNAYEASFGKNIIPDHDFSKAKTIVSVGADFLTSWLLPTQFATQYGTRRNPDGEWMSKHFQFESVMSVTGSNADYRGMIKPSQQANVLAYILKAFNVNTGVSTEVGDAKAVADEAIKALKASKGESLVVSGSNNTAVQILVNKLNTILGAYGTTLSLDNAINLHQSNDEKMNKFVDDAIAGKAADVVIFMGVNPVYTHPKGKALADAMSKIKTSVSLSMHADETASRCTFICPDNHALESWMDYNPKTSHYAIAQPTIRPLFNTSSSLESVLIWAGKAERGGKDSKVAHDYISKLWEQYGFAGQTKYTDFHTYWNMTIHNSVAEDMPLTPSGLTFNDAALTGLAGKLPKGGELEVVMYQKAGIGTGIQANNPWLQELPDPMTKVTWDNYITMNPVEMTAAGYATTFDQENGLNMATVKVGNEEVTLPVYPLPGQAPKTIGIALGYGRGADGENIGKAAFKTKEYGGNETLDNGNATPIGANVYRFVNVVSGTLAYEAVGSIAKSEGVYPIAATQIHHTVMARHSIVRETTLDIYKANDRSAFNPEYTLQKLDEHGNHVAAPMSEFDLWDAHPVENIGHRWGMTVDLSSCIGCGACLIACQSENNVPVVGKDEVRRGREMHWLRIDRYFASDVEATIGSRTEEFSYSAAEIAAVNPKVVHMPMMCHHCNHAPCETVCPVAATTHSNEGLNQMTYNRCIGTRYCANNCPYKVRRFNWFNYPSYKKFTEINPAQDDLGRMVLNPDVTVRTRGVMEKCSFCVQRIQSGKLTAKKEGRPVIDGDYVTACADACPTNAIIVGDWNDSESMIRKSADSTRSYQALEEVGVKPNVWFKVKVRNEKNEALEKLQVAHAGHGAAEAHGEEKKSHH